MLSAKRECLSQMIFFGISSLRRALAEYVDHYNAERPHQALDNSIPVPSGTAADAVGDVVRSDRLGGFLDRPPNDADRTALSGCFDTTTARPDRDRSSRAHRSQGIVRLEVVALHDRARIGRRTSAAGVRSRGHS